MTFILESRDVVVKLRFVALICKPSQPPPKDPYSE